MGTHTKYGGIYLITFSETRKPTLPKSRSPASLLLMNQASRRNVVSAQPLPTFSAALCPIRWSSFLFMRRMRENYKNLLKYADALTDIAEVDNLRADLKAFVQAIYWRLQKSMQSSSYLSRIW